MYFIRIHKPDGSFVDRPYGHDAHAVRSEHATVTRDPRLVKRVEMHDRTGCIETFFDSSWNTDRQIAAEHYNQTILWTQQAQRELEAMAPLMDSPDLRGWDLLAKRLGTMETAARNLASYAEATKVGMGGREAA